MKEKYIKNLFYLAGAVNILGTLTLSRFFTNESLVQIDPTIISSSGLILIIVWGLAFLATSNHYQKKQMDCRCFCFRKNNLCRHVVLLVLH